MVRAARSTNTSAFLPARYRCLCQRPRSDSRDRGGPKSHASRAGARGSSRHPPTPSSRLGTSSAPTSTLVTRADASGALPAEIVLTAFRADAGIRGNILATFISSDASDAPRTPDDLDDLAAGARIYAGRLRLRALSGVSRVVVRVHSGACCEVPGDAGHMSRKMLDRLDPCQRLVDPVGIERQLRDQLALCADHADLQRPAGWILGPSRLGSDRKGPA